MKRISKLKNKLLLLTPLLLFPITVFAESVGSSGEGIDLSMAIFMEAFVTIHMSVFVLKPLSMIIGKEENNKKIFWRMFIIRAIVLLYFDFFITTGIAIVDFLAVFIGAFIVVPISASVTKTPLNQRSNQVMVNTNRTTNLVVPQQTIINSIICSQCGLKLKSTDKFCGNCGAANKSYNNQPINTPKQRVTQQNYDPMFKLSEEALVEEFINRELQKAGINKNANLIPPEILKKRILLTIIFSILLFLFVSSIFFHLAFHILILSIAILFIIYLSIKKYDLIKYLKKEIKSRPSEKISNIVMSKKMEFVEDKSKTLLATTVVIAVVLPLIIFMKPRIFYEKVDNGYTVRFYTYGLTNFTSATIPETYNNEKVVSIRGDVFSNMYFLKEISLPNTITEIRGQAFKNDIKLERINIPNKLEYLGGGAFYNCSSIKSIELPETLTYIGGEAFSRAKSLQNINIPSKITQIRGNTFEYCTSLVNIEIPDSVVRIGGHAFYGCSSLARVIISEDSQLNEIGSSAFRQCPNLYDIEIPEDTIVNERAFKESPTEVLRHKEEPLNVTYGKDNYNLIYKEYNNMGIDININERAVIKGYNTSKGTALIKYKGSEYFFNYDNMKLNGADNNHIMIENLYILISVTGHVTRETYAFKNEDFKINIRDLNTIPNEAFFNLNYQNHDFYKLQISEAKQVKVSNQKNTTIVLNDIQVNPETGIKTYKYTIDGKEYQVSNIDEARQKIDNYYIQFIGLYNNALEIKIHYN